MGLLIQADTEEHPFINVGNVRLTLVKKNGWAGPDVHYYLRIQGYRTEDASQLFHGAEVPLANPRSAYRLITAIATLMVERFPDSSDDGEGEA